jgi:hypothetical protein
MPAQMTSVAVQLAQQGKRLRSIVHSVDEVVTIDVAARSSILIALLEDPAIADLGVVSVVEFRSSLRHRDSEQRVV